MSKAKKITLGVLVAAAALGGLLATRPSSYRVERSVRVEAPAEVVIAELADLQRWRSWATGKQFERGLAGTYAGPAAGVGSSYYWWDPALTTRGSMIVTRVAADRVELTVDVERPRRASHDVELRLAPDGGATRVAWITTGQLDLAARVRALLAPPAAAVGRELESSLAGLKRTAEARARLVRRRVERSAIVAAPPPRVLALLSDLRQWARWSPWELPDLDVMRSYGGPATGTGSSYYATGRHGAARTRLTVVGEDVDGLQLELERGIPPATTLRDLELKVVAEESGTRVTWAMAGEDDAAGVTAPTSEEVMSTDLEEGLARLGRLFEGDARTTAPDVAKPRLSKR